MLLIAAACSEGGSSNGTELGAGDVSQADSGGADAAEPDATGGDTEEPGDVDGSDAAGDTSTDDADEEDADDAVVTAVDVVPDPDIVTPDPCLTGNGGCDPHATCKVADGGAVCTCEEGYSGPGTSCSYDGVVIRIVDTHEVGDVVTSKPADPAIYESVTIETENGGETTVFTAPAPEDGEYFFAGVPEGPYTLVLRRHYTGKVVGAKGVVNLYGSSERVLELGNYYSYRAQTTELTEPSFVSISGKLTQPWQTYSEDEDGTTHELEDQIVLYSRGAFLFSTTSGGASEPESSPPGYGASALSGWRVDLLGTSLIGDARALDGSLGDDLTAIHMVDAQGPITEEADPWSGFLWQSARAWLTQTGVTLANGGELAISGDFQTGPEQKFVLDLDGSAFYERVAGMEPFITSGNVNVNVTMESGTPNPLTGPFAYLVDATVFALAAWMDPLCNPSADPCDVQACPNGCKTKSKQVFPGDKQYTFSYSNPFDYGQLIASGSLSYTIRVTGLLPADPTTERVRGLLTVSDSADALSGKLLSPSLSLPRDITIGGKTTPFDAITTGLGLTPAVSWVPPVAGVPTMYRVSIVELDDLKDDQGNPSFRRGVLTRVGTDTEFRIPPGVLVAGRHYNVEISAYLVDAFDPKSPDRPRTKTTIARVPSGIFAPCSCHAAASCSIEGDTETCVCRAGWEGDGKACSPLPCTLNNGGCPDGATCTNEGPLAVCACGEGLVVAYGECVPDPCLQANGGCAEGAVCTAVEDSAVCACPPCADNEVCDGLGACVIPG